MNQSDILATFLSAAGGLGLFLIGMTIMTEGLRELAGDTIRSALMRFTSSPVTGAVSGAIGTAILQSSSATTVAVVGFVGAGLMTFNASLGIIFGANIGTTVTGWLVALLGFKLQLGTLLLPLVLAGALLRRFGSGTAAATGYALAGFGLIFVGIGALQQGLSGMQGLITPETLPGDTWDGRILTVLLGVLATLITQSSSAGVATTLTALYTGVIGFEQGLALVIGMDIGTTFTAVLATLGGSTAARRTGVSHLVYNLFTGSGAVLLITPYIRCWQVLLPGGLAQHAEVALVAFHSLFNLLGVVLVLPFTDRFARLMRRLVPETFTPYAIELDRRLLTTPALALTSLQETLLIQYVLLLQHVDAILHTDRNDRRTDLVRAQTALDETQEYLEAIHLQGSADTGWERLLALIHVLDHMQRLHERCEEDEDRAITARESDTLSELHDLLTGEVRATLEGIGHVNWTDPLHTAEQTEQAIARRSGPQRDLIAAGIANGSLSVPYATDCLEAVRWLERVAHHIARINHHLYRAVLASGK
jgi:phosphate:Na+ symporter